MHFFVVVDRIKPQQTEVCSFIVTKFQQFKKNLFFKREINVCRTKDNV